MRYLDVFVTTSWDYAVRLSDIEIRNKVFMVAGVPVPVGVALGGISLWGLSRMEQAAWWLGHTTHVINEANAIVASAVDMETGMRGFAISGEDSFLEPYTASKARLADLVDKLQQTASDDPAQVGRLSDAEGVITEWQSKVAEAQVAMRQMDEKTQHNAALVEETNAAIEQTERQAGELDMIVDIFELGDTKMCASRPAEPRQQPSVRKAAKTFLSQGNAAISQNWSEF